MSMLRHVNMATEKNIFRIIADNSKASVSEITDLVSTKFNVKADESTIKLVKRRLSKRYSSYGRKKSWKEVAELGSDTDYVYVLDSRSPEVLDSLDTECQSSKSAAVELLAEQRLDDSVLELESPAKVVRKSFQFCDDRQQKRRTQQLSDAISEFIANDCDGELSVTQVLGYLLYKENRQAKKDIADLGWKLYTKDSAKINPSISVEVAVALMHWMHSKM